MNFAQQIVEGPAGNGRGLLNGLDLARVLDEAQLLRQLGQGDQLHALQCLLQREILVMRQIIGLHAQALHALRLTELADDRGLGHAVAGAAAVALGGLPAGLLHIAEVGHHNLRVFGDEHTALARVAGQPTDVLRPMDQRRAAAAVVQRRQKSFAAVQNPCLPSYTIRTILL